MAYYVGSTVLSAVGSQRGQDALEVKRTRQKRTGPVGRHHGAGHLRRLGVPRRHDDRDALALRGGVRVGVVRVERAAQLEVGLVGRRLRSYVCEWLRRRVDGVLRGLRSRLRRLSMSDEC